MEKYKYAPGRPGIGTTGKDGSVGSNGISMLFTDIDTITQATDITRKINGNYTLWEGTDEPLPGGRAYQNGDLFIDTTGKVYEINLNISARFEYKNIHLSTAQFFTTYVDALADGRERKANTFTSYLIDSINTLSSVDYTLYPSKIYNVDPKNFTRIEYCDLPSGVDSYIPFTLFATGDVNEAYALAIAKDSANTFHIGNVDDFLVPRNIDIKFDVRNLMANKTGNVFTAATPQGTVLTNYEIDSNVLFDPIFNFNPDSFMVTSTPSPAVGSIDVSWNKYDMFPGVDPATINNTIVDVHFYRQTPTYVGRTFNGNDPSLRHIVLNNVDSSGKVVINNLVTGAPYEGYLVAAYNGWQRRTASKSAGAGFTLTIAPTSSICVSTPQNYTATSDSPITYYHWTATGGTINSGEYASVANVTWNTPGAGSLKLDYTNTYGYSGSKTVPITVVGIPTAVLTHVPATPCSDSAITFTATSDIGTYYVFKVNGTPVQSGTSNTYNSAGLSGGALVKVTVTAAGSPGMCPNDSNTITMIQRPATPGVITGATAPCTGDPESYSISAVSGAVDYTWSVPPTWTITSGQGTTSISVTVGSQTGFVSVTANPPAGCSPNLPQTLAVSLGAVPAKPGAISGSITPCPGVPTTYSITAVPGATSYDWTYPTPGWSGSSTTNSIDLTPSTTNGKVYVRAKNSCGDSDWQETSTINIQPAIPAQPGAISGSTTPCAGTVGATYSIAAVPNATSYNWTVPAGWTITSNGTTGMVCTVGSVGQTGDVTVTASNGCGTSSAQTLTITSIGTNSTAPTSVSISNQGACNGISKVLTASGGTLGTGADYKWYSDSGCTNLLYTGNDYSVNPAAGSSTTYWVRREGGCGGTTATTSGTVNVASNVGAVTFSQCTASRNQEAASVQYTASAPNQTSISYSLNQAALDAGCTINAGTGLVNYTSNWYGTSTITATAQGCNGPTSNTCNTDTPRNYVTFESFTGPGGVNVNNTYSPHFYINVYGNSRNVTVYYYIRKSNDQVYQTGSETFFMASGLNQDKYFTSIVIEDHGYETYPLYDCYFELLSESAAYIRGSINSTISKP